MVSNIYSKKSYLCLTPPIIDYWLFFLIVFIDVIDEMQAEEIGDAANMLVEENISK